MSNPIEVRVARVPGTVKTVFLTTGATVSDALSAAEISLGENEKANVNGAAASNTQTLQNGDTIVIAAGAKGNV